MQENQYQQVLQQMVNYTLGEEIEMEY